MFELLDSLKFCGFDGPAGIECKNYGIVELTSALPPQE